MVVLICLSDLRLMRSSRELHLQVEQFLSAVGFEPMTPSKGSRHLII